MENEVLLTPGPTHIPPQVLAAMQEPKMHHRTDVFKRHFRQALDGLKSLLKIGADPILLAGSGTAAMEAALLNSCNVGETVAVVNAGKFGERWLLLGKQLGLKVIEIKIPWGKAAGPDDLKNALRSNPAVKAVCLQQCETSTGVLHPIAAICSAVKEINPAILTVVDAVSSVGTLALYPQESKIDILAAATHKGLMLPPGLSFVYLSELAWQEAERVQARTLYFHLLTERKAHAKDTTAWTPAVHHILGLNAALNMISIEGAENVFARHAKASRACRDAVEVLGLSIFAEIPAPGVTSIVMPASVDGESVRAYMLKQRKVRITGGQDELKGKIIRIGHMGYFSTRDLEIAFEALEESLVEHGVRLQRGEAVKALNSSLKRSGAAA